MSSVTNQVERLYALFVRLMSNLQSPFLLAIRLYWGWQFAMVGWGKLHNLAHVTEFFGSLHLPAPAFTAASTAAPRSLNDSLLASTSRTWQVWQIACAICTSSDISVAQPPSVAGSGVACPSWSIL